MSTVLLAKVKGRLLFAQRGRARGSDGEIKKLKGRG